MGAGSGSGSGPEGVGAGCGSSDEGVGLVGDSGLLAGGGPSEAGTPVCQARSESSPPPLLTTEIPWPTLSV